MTASPPTPRLATALLRLLTSDDDFEAIGGDLEEMYRGDLYPRLGALPARLWYWRQVLSLAAARVAFRTEPSPSLSTRSSMAAFRQDLSYALRALRKQPGFTLVAVLTLALGIGANVAIFSLVNAVLFKRLPFRDPDGLMMVHLLSPDRENAGVFRIFPWSYPKYLVFREDQRVFDSTAVFTGNAWNGTGLTVPERLAGELVEASYFETLGVSAAVGRTFSADEARTPGSAPLVVLGYGIWQRLFGGDPSVIGRSIGLDGAAYTILGVLPPGFRGLTGEAQLFVPLTTLSAADLGEAWNHSYQLVARRKPGVTSAQALAATTLLGARVHAAYAVPPGRVATPAAWSADAVPLDDERVDPLIRRSVLLLLAAVGAVLLIACVNLANLMLVRAMGRQQEVAIRSALGASRFRIIRQLMTESLVLAGFGTGLGLAVAYGVVRYTAAILPDLKMMLPNQTAGLTRVSLGVLGLDSTTLIFTLAIAIGAAVMFGLGPAWRATRRDLNTTMRANAGSVLSSGTSAFSVRNALIVGEMALALVLLSAGGLMLKSVARLQATELGFAPSALTTFRLSMPSPQYDRMRATQLLDHVLEGLQARADIRGAAYGSCAPLSGPCNGTSARFPDRPPVAPGTAPAVGVFWASPTYFETLGIRLLHGRVFTNQDRFGQPKVVVVNETAARAFWGGEDAIGKRIAVGQGGFDDSAEVVGIVADVRYGAIEKAVTRDVYLPLLQSGRSSGVIFLRSATPPALLVPMIRREVQSLDPNLPLVDIKTMEARFGDATWQTRMSAWLLGAFAALALVLAAVGIYGVMSQGVAQRAREIGVRLALGATRSDIFRLILGRTALLAVAGVALGVALAVPSMKVLTALLYQVAPGDPVVITSLAVTLLVVAVLAGYLPARRATLVDPLVTLKSE